MSRKIHYLRTALTELKSLTPAVRREARDLIDSLAEDPFLSDCHKLRGHEDYYRIAFGDGRYRLIYRVRPEKVIIERIRLRGEAYQGL